MFISTTEHEMDTCVPNCPYKLSNHGNKKDENFKGTCGLPDCRNEAGRFQPVSDGQKEAPKAQKPYNMPGCRDGEACTKGSVTCLYKQPGTSEDEKFKGPCGLPDCRNEAGGTRPVSDGQKKVPKTQNPGPKAQKPCNMPGCQDGEACAKGTVNCLYNRPGTSTENEMATCGLPGCRSKSGIQSSGGKFKGTCGLPDCRNKAAGGSRSRRGSQGAEGAAGGKGAGGSKAQKPCDIPGCMDEEARAMGKEVCLYRHQPRHTSLMGKLGCAYQAFWKIWQKIQSDPYYWSLFKSIIYFVMGLKLFRDMAAGFNPPPPSLSKCPPPPSLPKCQKPKS